MNRQRDRRVDEMAQAVLDRYTLLSKDTAEQVRELIEQLEFERRMLEIDRFIEDLSLALAEFGSENKPE